MRKHYHNQAGFTAVDILFIIVTLSIVAAIGFFITLRHSQKNSLSLVTVKSYTTTTVSKSAPATTSQSSDPTVNWKSYSDSKGQFSFRYPTDWTFYGCTDASLALLGPPNTSTAHCDSEGTSEVFVTSYNGDKRSDPGIDLHNSNYTNFTSKPVTISGVNGEQETGSAIGQDNGQGIPGLPDGTKVILYLFFTNGKTYEIEYNQTPTFPDELSIFNLLVTNTFKFNG